MSKALEESSRRSSLFADLEGFALCRASSSQVGCVRAWTQRNHTPSTGIRSADPVAAANFAPSLHMMNGPHSHQWHCQDRSTDTVADIIPA